MVPIDEYILNTKSYRQQHLDLSACCIERGGPTNGGLSSYCKGLMAHLLDTTIPAGHKIHICHACNNARCSNPAHLYWGTAQENSIDRMNNGGSTVWENTVNKYGYDVACGMNSKTKQGNNNGSGNKGKVKSGEHKDKISKSIKARWDMQKADVAK